MRGSIGVGAPVSTRKFKLITSKTKIGNGPFPTANKIILLPRPPPFQEKNTRSARYYRSGDDPESFQKNIPCGII